MTEMEGTGMVPPKLQHTQQMWPAGVVSWWRDPTDSTMLWWQDAGGLWHRWRDLPPAGRQGSGGWAYKMACLLHMRDHGETEAFDWALKRLGMHPGMRRPMEEINQRYQHLGASAYTYCFPGQ